MKLDITSRLVVAWVVVWLIAVVASMPVTAGTAMERQVTLADSLNPDILPLSRAAFNKQIKALEEQIVKNAERIEDLQEIIVSPTVSTVRRASAQIEAEQLQQANFRFGGARDMLIEVRDSPNYRTTVDAPKKEGK